MKKKIILIAIAVFVVGAVALTMAAWFYVSSQLSRLEAYRHEITSSLEEALGRKIDYRDAQATLTLRAGLSLRIDDLAVHEKNAPEYWLTVRSAFFRMELLPLLGGRIVLREVIMDQLRMQLIRSREGTWNIDDLLAERKQPKFALSVRKLSIEDGEVNFTDQAVGAAKRSVSLADISFRIDPYLWNDTFQVRLSAALNAAGNSAQITASGKVRPAGPGQRISQNHADFTARLSGLDLSAWSVYVGEISPFKRVAGRADLEVAWSGSIDRFEAKGNLTVVKPVLDYPEVFSRPLSPGRLSLQVIASRDANELTVDLPGLTIDGFSVATRLKWRDIDTEDPYFELIGSSSALSRKDVEAYVPWALIGHDVADFVNRHVSEGAYRLLDLKLSGRIGQITNMSSPENANVLFLRASIDGGIFSINDETPAFRDIHGIMELMDRRFYLKDMNGRFGTSPFALDGHISDFAASGPPVYTAQARVEPRQTEARWLIGAERFADLSFDGLTTLHLKGHGPADRFEIQADWDLTGAAIGLPDVFNKPPGKPAKLNTRMLLDDKALDVQSFQVELHPLTLDGAVAFRFDNKRPARIRLRSDGLDLKETAWLFPSMEAYGFAGLLRADITVRGDFSDPALLTWTGRMSFSDVSFIPWEQAAAMSGLSGSAVFKNSRMDTSRFKGRFGRSEVSGQCSVEKWREPKLACRITSPALFVSDAGLNGGNEEFVFQNVRGRFALDGDSLNVERLSLQTGKTVLTLNGDIPFGTDERITLALNAPLVESEDIVPLFDLKMKEGKKPSVQPLILAATINIGRLIFGSSDLLNLIAQVTMDDRLMTIESLTARIAEGALAASGRIHFPSAEDNRYEASVSLKNASLSEIQHILDIGDRVVTGRLSMKADLKASGNDFETFKKSIEGTVTASAENGMLRKFAVLSKVFSILNVSQLFRLQLPDMVKDGMPYTAMTGDFRISSGVLTSENFLIDSNAMQVSAVGQVDLINQTLDNIIGVHPLQTIDRIAARIPVAGWILTDERGRLITVHFEAEGPWDNPKVTAIPAKSLTKGTLDMFRRIFELPEKLVTDTGDVLLGR